MADSFLSQPPARCCRRLAAAARRTFSGIFPVTLAAVLPAALLFLCGCSGPDSSAKSNSSGSPAAVSAERSIGAESAAEAAPEIRGTLLSSGAAVSARTDFAGKVLIVNFWATWCAPCVAELPALERMYQQLKAKYPEGGFELVAINADIDTNLDAVKEMVHSRGLTFPVILDPEGANVKAFNLTGFPETFFIDRSGSKITIKDPETGKSADRLLSDRPWDTAGYFDLVTAVIGKK